jgi:hypothetical protein
LPPSIPEQPQIRQPTGDSTADAILDVQQNETDGVDWEYVYLSYHPCDHDTLWKVQKQALVNAGGRAYDLLHVVCPTTKAERDIFFDVTPYFGKL